MEKRNLRKTRTGIVVSDKMDKTVVVAIRDEAPPLRQDSQQDQEVQGPR